MTDLHSLFFGEEIGFNFDRERNIFINHMDMLKGQSVQEHTLYKKWKEISSYYNNTADLNKSSITECRIWKPIDIYNKDITIEQIHSIDPEIIVVEPESIFSDDWKYLRVMGHTMEYTPNKGRVVKIIIRDKTSNQYLGVCSLGSDVTSIKVRDEWIGWSNEDKFKKGKLNSTAIGTCILPTQPFGYNFLGGKLVASLLCSQVIRDYWKDKFGDELIGITTTSLYGSHSMYQRIPYWKELGKSSGKMSIKPDDDVYRIWIDYLKEHYKDKYDVLMERTGPKQQILTFLYKLLQINSLQYQHGFQRGVYFMEFYQNSRLFLQDKIQQQDLILHDKVKDDVAGVMNWWKEKSINRYTNLLENDRIKEDRLYYRKIAQMSWEDTKQLYIGEVGR